MGEWLSVPMAEELIERRIRVGVIHHRSLEEYYPYRYSDHQYADLYVEYDKNEQYFNLIDVMIDETWNRNS